MSETDMQAIEAEVKSVLSLVEGRKRRAKMVLRAIEATFPEWSIVVADNQQDKIVYGIKYIEGLEERDEG